MSRASGPAPPGLRCFSRGMQLEIALFGSKRQQLPGDQCISRRGSAVGLPCLLRVEHREIGRMDRAQPDGDRIRAVHRGRLSRSPVPSGGDVHSDTGIVERHLFRLRRYEIKPDVWLPLTNPRPLGRGQSRDLLRDTLGWPDQRRPPELHDRAKLSCAERRSGRSCGRYFRSAVMICGD